MCMNEISDIYLFMYMYISIYKYIYIYMYIHRSPGFTMNEKTIVPPALLWNFFAGGSMVWAMPIVMRSIARALL